MWRVQSSYIAANGTDQGAVNNPILESRMVQTLFHEIHKISGKLCA